MDCQFLPNTIIGNNLSDIVQMLRRAEFKDVFSLFYIQPTVFHSDLDRGFSIIDYELNDELVSHDDLAQLNELNIMFKFDLVVNHLSTDWIEFAYSFQSLEFFAGPH